MPPLLWLGLCLDSGANKSGIMTAVEDIISGFEKELLERALAEARTDPPANDMEEDDEGGQPLQDEGARAKKRRVQMRKRVAAVCANKPQMYCDEGSLPAIGVQMAQNGHRAVGLCDEPQMYLPAIGMQMAQNGHRAVGLYDEDRFLLRALAHGEGSGFNPATVSKLFNGSSWKRSVVKDQNRFLMNKTCLCLAMTFHIEEWHDFLSKDDQSLGVQSRLLMFHSMPSLDRAETVLDSTVYGPARALQPPPRLPESLLSRFVRSLARSEQEHATNRADYDNVRKYIPYFFALGAFEDFKSHYDAQVLKQELSYLDPKKFSQAGKLKSLPWRLALLLHVWAHACPALRLVASLCSGHVASQVRMSSWREPFLSTCRSNRSV